MTRDVEILQRGLTRWLPDGHRITSVVALSTGHSNETYVVNGLDRVLRMPPSEEGLLPPYDMAAQHALQDSISRVPDGPPVPRTRELCLDSEVLGAPFYLMDLAAGEPFDHPDIPDWLIAASPEQRNGMCRQWLDAVIAVTHIPVEDMVGVPHHSPADEASYWLAVATRSAGPESLLKLLAELAADPPRTTGPPTAVHGDTKHGNCLWEAGRLTAFVDWELARVADPMLDLANTLCYFPDGHLPVITAGFDLPGWWDRGQVVEAWELGTGRTAIDLPRWEGLAMARLAAVLSAGASLHTRGISDDPRFLVWRDTLPQYVDLIRFRMSLPG